MKRNRKAALAVSAAIAAGGLAAGAKAMAGGRADAKRAPDAGVAEKDPPKDPANKNVVKVKKTQAQDGESDYGLAMPAGTLYDVIRRKDVP